MQILLILVTLGQALFATEPPTLEVQISTGWLRDQFRIEKSVPLPINENQKGFSMIGTGSALISTRIYPSIAQEALALEVIADISVNIPPHVSGRPMPVLRPGLQIDFDSQVLAPVQGRKFFVLNQYGMALGDTGVAVGNIQTSFSNVQATRRRLLGGGTANAPLIRGAAPGMIDKKLQESKPEMQQKLKEEVTTQFDKIFKDFEKNFELFFMEPIVKKEFFGGPIQFFSGAQSIGVEVVKKKGVPIVRSELVSQAEPIALRITPDVLEWVIQQKIGGSEITSLELVDTFQKVMPRPKTPEEVLRHKNEVLMTFADKAPMQFAFKRSEILWTMNFAKIESDKGPIENAKIEIKLKIAEQPTGLVFITADPKVELRSSAKLDKDQESQVKFFFEEMAKNLNLDFSRLSTTQELPGKLQFGSIRFTEGACRVSFKTKP